MTRDTELPTEPASALPSDVPVPAHLRIARRIASRIDAILEPAAQKALDRLAEQNQARAMADPAYAAIENKRTNADGTITMIDESQGLGMAEWEGQSRILDSVSRHPWWENLARHAVDTPASAAVTKRVRRRQRIARGWDDTATWSLDTHLAGTLADQLDHLAATTHGWPQSEEFPAFTDWQEALTATASKLRRYSCFGFDVVDPETEAAIIADAQDALRWVADHLASLWD